MEEISEIKKNLATKKLVIGTNNTIKNLKTGKVKKVYITSNCSKLVKDNLAHYCGFDNTPIVNLGIPNDELGVICKKQFSISVLSLLK